MFGPELAAWHPGGKRLDFPGTLLPSHPNA